MKYEEPKIQILVIDNEDIVRTSVKPGNPLEDENFGQFPTQ